MQVRLIRVFVSSPGDVSGERGVLDDAIASINRTDGQAGGFRLELFRWEMNVTPKIGPGPQAVVDQQTPEYDVYIGIMSTRFGTPTGRHGSGTEKEFKDALKKWKAAGAPWIAFYFDVAPKTLTKTQEIQQYLKVSQFRERLDKQGIVATYTGVRGSKDSFYEKVSEHLRKIVRQLFPLQRGAEPARGSSDPTAYLRDLYTKTEFIDIRGLPVGEGRANRFPIEDLFISLTTTQTVDEPGKDTKRTRRRGRSPAAEGERALPASRTVPLHEALVHDRLVVIGDPGAGKTTFLRRVANALCRKQLGETSDAGSLLGIRDRTFPLFVRLSDLAAHLQRHTGDASAPGGEDAPAWLSHYLETDSRGNETGLDAEFFRRQLDAGQCTVLLDGLDEAPDRLLRERLSRLIENVTRAHAGCRFVVSSRPSAYKGRVVLPKFAHSRIDPLSDENVEIFLTKWCQAIYVESEKLALGHCRELLDALRGRAEIRRMARNPVMLTALAVVHWNERRLPEQRADLYSSIITWLSRAREQRPGRATADRTVVVLQELALAMQDAPDGRKTQVPQREAAEMIAGEFDDGQPTREAIRRAERFLDEEEVDSGIVVARGDEVAFWHLTFQEFMAARAVASRLEDEQKKILFANRDKIYLADWRELVLLLSGALHQQGKKKVDWLIGTILAHLGSSPTLAEEAHRARLISGILRDLQPAKYQLADARYGDLLARVMAIFDREQSQRVPVEERIAAADALGQAGDPRIDFARGDYWVPIPAGKFLMGSQKTHAKLPNYDEDGSDAEAPVHEVYLDAYRIARYPVTVSQFRQFVEHDGYADERWWSAGGFGEFQAPDGWEDQQPYPSRPVVGVSWFEAAAFCAWLHGCADDRLDAEPRDAHGYLEFPCTRPRSCRLRS